jgi:hypothetical protein
MDCSDSRLNDKLLGLFCQGKGQVEIVMIDSWWAKLEFGPFISLLQETIISC